VDIKLSVLKKPKNWVLLLLQGGPVAAGVEVLLGCYLQEHTDASGREHVQPSSPASL
jgi:hypothetical protein